MQIGMYGTGMGNYGEEKRDKKRRKEHEKT
jgi:hypothetical protein